MRGLFWVLLMVGLASACSANETANPGQRCGQGESCAANGVCYRGFCIADGLQSGTGPDVTGIVRVIDGGLAAFGDAEAQAGDDAIGPADVGGAAGPALDAGAPSAAEDAGQAATTGSGVTEPAAMVGAGATDAAVPVRMTSLPNDGSRRSVCYGDKPCNKDLFCAAPVGGKPYPGFCTDGCRTDANCPALDGIAQVCSADSQCHVMCAGAQGKGAGPCPVNQICRDVRNTPFDAASWYCTYPDNSGSRAVPTYGACSTQHGAGDCAGADICHQPEVSGLSLPTPSGTAGYCAGECAAATDCLVPPGTTARPLCAGARCEFDCAGAGANTCPATMNCRDLSNNPLAPAYRCVITP